MKLSQRDKRFFIFTAIASIAIVSFFHIASLFITEPITTSADPAISPDLREVIIQQVEPLSVIDLKQKLLLNNQPTMLMIYTSWCPHCRNAIPKMLELQKNYLTNAQTIYLSIDRNEEKLLRYLAQSEYYKAYTPYWHHTKRQGDILAFAKQYGMGFQGGIPYVAIFDQHGKLVAETTSGGWQSVVQAIKELK